MCGIAGYIARSPLAAERINKTISCMKRRGPDSQDYKSFHINESYITLIFARLAIIDLDPRSNQPFSLGPLSLVFNGEIYNYIELRRKLESRGITLRTTSDTEVLLHYYQIYGAECVEHFEGMWAFAVFDSSTSKLFLSRDRFGEKPLYYAKLNNGYVFASEIKALKALSAKSYDLNYNQLLRYLVLGYRQLSIYGEQYYNGIHELAPGSNLVLSTESELKLQRYWQPKIKVQEISEANAVEKTRHLLIESMRLRMRADVPLAFCLSGGVDSAALAAIASKILLCKVHTFSIIDPDPRYNESENIEASIKDLGCKHTLIQLKHEDFLVRLKALIAYHDGPLATISYYVHSHLSQAISEQGYKVAISGSGADELFTGYYDHFLLQLAELHGSIYYDSALADWQKFVATNIRNPYLLDHARYIKNPNDRRHLLLESEQYLEMLKPAYRGGIKLEWKEEDFKQGLLKGRMLNELSHESIPIILHEDDLNSMLYSVENRSPYLDSNLFDHCLSLPNHLLIKNGYAKNILREAVTGILNDSVRLSRRKIGFNASLHSLLDLKSKVVQDQILNSSLVYEIVDQDRIAQLLKAESLSDSSNKFLFNFINVMLFLEQEKVL